MNLNDDIQKSLNSTTSSTNSELINERRLKMDPNYKWLLKDLNLNNNKRVIDVTALLHENDTSKMSQVADEYNENEKDSEPEEGEILEETEMERDGQLEEEKKNNDQEEQYDEENYNTSDSDASYEAQKKYKDEIDEDETSEKSSTSSDVLVNLN